MSAPDPQPDGNIIESLQSLIVAFVLAMTFRGFVTEGFVIPTGSMAPTLMGQHLLQRSAQTGYVYRTGAKDVLDHYDRKLLDKSYEILDPMIGRQSSLGSSTVRELKPEVRMGDRILVLKSLYPFCEPRRFDVVVFKNPTDPDGASENYIKRLIGLGGEKIWLVDGDVFAGPADEPERLDDYVIQRKPEHVQRAVWQPVHDSDYLPRHPDRLSRHYRGTPWIGNAAHWQIDDARSYRSSTDEPTSLQWASHRRKLDDWTPYNMFWYQGRVNMRVFNVSDLRISAGIVADQAGLDTRLELIARGHVFEFSIGEDDGGSQYQATVRYRSLERTDEDAWSAERSVAVRRPKPGRVVDVEFWHVDQSMAIYLDGKRVVDLTYAWLPAERLAFSTGLSFEEAELRLPAVPPTPPVLRWHFEGSPVTLHRVRVDRDLYYQPVNLGRSGAPGYGTHPKEPAVLGPDQFFMLGDNSPASQDSRLWGNPDPLVAYQIDDSPFVVNRKLLLGKAWVVYFPAPYRITKGSKRLIPDFGRLRFIR
ncbi:MAG: S26 family signal peptidase [Gemmatimonadota bacterium]